MPQECGNRTKVAYAYVTDEEGFGLQFKAREMDFSVLPFTPHELENAMHHYELPPVHYTIIRAAMKQMGVGGDDSWGSKPYEEHLIQAEHTLEFEFSFKGVKI